jgi:hypothetical protein
MQPWLVPSSIVSSCQRQPVASEALSPCQFQAWGREVMLARGFKRAGRRLVYPMEKVQLRPLSRGFG